MIFFAVKLGLHPTSSHKVCNSKNTLSLFVTTAFHSIAAAIPPGAGRPNARGQLVSQMLAGFQDETVSFYFCAGVPGPKRAQ